MITVATQEQTADSGRKIYTSREINLGIKVELGSDYIHFNIAEKLLEEYQAFIAHCILLNGTQRHA